ncbi:sperm flagellar protein 1-like [Culicoides brevitarsis]|uniref:sperm flagellar protein 1-like n=1 Tax=Culicoides brevitarsis TaxID=469753 RepID=UPI00307C25B7
MLENLTEEQETELMAWIENFKLSRPSKRLGRDFSDGVLLAEILKQIFPKMVDLHNYPSCSGFQQKCDNWKTLERKILSKINVLLSDATIFKLAEANTDTVKAVLYETMKKSQVAVTAKASNMSRDSEISQTSEIITINMEQRIGDHVEVTPQKLIFYNLYEKLEQVMTEKCQLIKILQQKNAHLESLLQLKNARIADLEERLNKKEILEQIVNDELE